jgi:aldehyde:ferredoxin oxidoreductase
MSQETSDGLSANQSGGLYEQVCRDSICRVLYVDLSKRRFWAENRPDIFGPALGGVGAGIRLLEEECSPGADPLGPENPIIFAVGPLVGMFPIASKTVALFKSPHTGNLGESHAGGRSAVSIRMAGYGAIVIRGTSASPVYLVIDGDRVYFRDASALWGMRSSFATAAIIRNRESGSGNRTIMRIGRAGERGITYAGVITETYRHFGRLGLGAVFGSKRLKAVVISGKANLPIPDRRAYQQVYDDIFQAATKSEVMRKYHELGTPVNTLPLNAIGGLPVRNLQAGAMPNAETLSGEYLAENYLGRRVACAHCPIACIHLAALRIPHPKEPYFYKTSMISYDYEPIYALGSMLGAEDPVGMLRLMEEAELVGLDAMSTGVTLAWATEALQKGLITTRETDALPLAWGDYGAYIEAVRRIISPPNDFYRALGRGAEYAASKYGGMDFALTFGGNEMPGYHTGPGAYLGFLTGARHSHLDSAGYSVDQAAIKKGEALTPEGLADALLREERWRQVLASLVVCFFARGVYTQEVVQRALSVMGQNWSGEALEQLGEDTLRRKQAFKLREGFDPLTLRIPARILEVASAYGALDEEFLREAVRCYFAAFPGAASH